MESDAFSAVHELFEKKDSLPGPPDEKERRDREGRRLRIEWKPFHLLLIIYVLIAVAGIVFQLCKSTIVLN